MLMRVIMALIALCVAIAGPEPDPDEGWADRLEAYQTALVVDAVGHYFDDPDDVSIPACWEDEALVVIVDHAHPDYGNTAPPLAGYLGCVPLDNLPVAGNRPAG